jgi:hypothetical protein
MIPADIKKKIHPLGEGKSGKIRFIHSDGKEHCFVTTINSLTGSRMSGFDSSAPSIDLPLKEIKNIFRNIRNSCDIIESIGDF